MCLIFVIFVSLENDDMEVNICILAGRGEASCTIISEITPFLKKISDSKIRESITIVSLILLYIITIIYVIVWIIKRCFVGHDPIYNEYMETIQSLLFLNPNYEFSFHIF